MIAVPCAVVADRKRSLDGPACPIKIDAAEFNYTYAMKTETRAGFRINRKILNYITCTRVLLAFAAQAFVPERGESAESVFDRYERQNEKKGRRQKFEK